LLAEDPGKGGPGDNDRNAAWLRPSFLSGNGRVCFKSGRGMGGHLVGLEALVEGLLVLRPVRGTPGEGRDKGSILRDHHVRGVGGGGGRSVPLLPTTVLEEEKV